mmetsp:Transcript_16318/g.21363  ORF Transcript_16318/g.21363 Transcript_16318/m.21363 type:complete len:206 (+) Transcript_16318:90-707(+)
MAIVSRAKRNSTSPSKMMEGLALVAAIFTIVIIIGLGGTSGEVTGNNLLSLSLSSSASSSSINIVNHDYHVDEICKNLPSIRPSGSYFLDDKIKAGLSPQNLTPAFKVGSYFAQKVPYHMATDIANFHLIQDLVKERKEGSLVLDIGANQGFYTYYLAALGMQVHAFEINEQNFKALQHGAEFNPRVFRPRSFVSSRTRPKKFKV